MRDYCDNCGRMQDLQTIILKDESGEANYCKDCVENNPHVKVNSTTEIKIAI